MLSHGRQKGQISGVLQGIRWLDQSREDEIRLVQFQLHFVCVRITNRQFHDLTIPGTAPDSGEETLPKGVL